jgi:hypothetical protein
MVYYDLRVTIPNLPLDLQTSDIWKDLIRLVFDDLPIKYIVGKEHKGKKGEIVDEHYHIPMELEEPIKMDTLRKRINRLGLKGNKMYCLRELEDLKEEPQRYWRYCLKQNLPVASKGFTELELDALHTVAHDEWNQRVIENKQAEEKMLNKNNFRNKLIKNLKELYNEVGQPTDKKLYIDIYKYYNKSHQTAPFKKMDDLVIDMKLELAYLTIEEYYDLRH